MSLAIHAVIQGPHNRFDMHDDDFVMICMAQDDKGTMFYDFELYSSDFEWLYKIVRHTKQNLEPFIIPEYESEQ
jgi:hypothetical protein